jgi:hypothetical protein
MDDRPRHVKRTWRLPFLEIQVDVGEERQEADLAAATEKRRGLGASWWAATPAAGLIMIGAGVWDGESWLVALGAILTGFGVWLTMRELQHRDLRGKATWVTVEVAVLLAGLGIAVAAEGTWLWVAIVAAVVLAPVFANAAAPERRA